MISHGISWCEYNFFVSLLLHVKVLQFKLHLFYEISFLEIKKLNIEKDQEKLPKYNLESHIKYEVTHKSCNGRFKIFGEYFAVCFWCSTRQTCNLCRVFFCLPCVLLACARHSWGFAVCLLFAVCQSPRHTANICFAVCPTVCRVLHLRHTAKAVFAVCSKYGTRQLGRFP